MSKWVKVDTRGGGYAVFEPAQVAFIYNERNEFGEVIPDATCINLKCGQTIRLMAPLKNVLVAMDLRRIKSKSAAESFELEEIRWGIELAETKWHNTRRDDGKTQYHYSATITEHDQPPSEETPEDPDTPEESTTPPTKKPRRSGNK